MLDNDTTTGGFGAMTTNADAPEVTQTSVRADLLQSLHIVTQRSVERIRKHVRVFAGRKVFASIEEPDGHFELTRIRHHGHDAINFFRRQFTGTIIAVSVARNNAKDRLAAVQSGQRRRQMAQAKRSRLPLCRVDIGLFEANVGVTTTNAFDGSQCVLDLCRSATRARCECSANWSLVACAAPQHTYRLAAVDVGVANTQNVRKFTSQNK